MRNSLPILKKQMILKTKFRFRNCHCEGTPAGAGRQGRNLDFFNEIATHLK
jgi:hypothetical protein